MLEAIAAPFSSADEPVDELGVGDVDEVEGREELVGQGFLVPGERRHAAPDRRRRRVVRVGLEGDVEAGERVPVAVGHAGGAVLVDDRVGAGNEVPVVEELVETPERQLVDISGEQRGECGRVDHPLGAARHGLGDQARDGGTVVVEGEPGIQQAAVDRPSHGGDAFGGGREGHHVRGHGARRRRQGGDARAFAAAPDHVGDGGGIRCPDQNVSGAGGRLGLVAGRGDRRAGGAVDEALSRRWWCDRRCHGCGPPPWCHRARG